MLSRYYHIDKATGVSIHKLSDTAHLFNACSIIVDKDQLQFERKITGIQTIDELTKQIAPNTLVALNLTGKGILTRQIAGTEEITPSNFSKIMPNANFDDFYIQHFVSGDQSFVTIIRKPEADHWISRLQQLNFKPLLLSLDAFPVDLVIPQLNIYGPQVIFNGHQVTRNEKAEWTGYQKREQAVATLPIKIEQEPIDEKLLLPYAAAFALVMVNRLNHASANVPLLNQALTTALENRKLKVNGAAVLFAVFILLLINFGIFFWLNTANNELTAKVGMLSQSTTDRTSLEEQIRQGEMLLQQIGWSHGARKSILTDQIAALLPAGVRWTSVSIDPLDQANSRNLKTIAFLKQEIRVTGTADQIIPVNEWIARIKTKPWVKGINLDAYNFNQELSTGQFTIIINY